ncbi:HEPN domain-containing protein [Leptospira jelokensis]|uniref:HEPN domain-containing protein n=1 Tax=Leptospira jelokensis TaxID=2484931 RepID=UPI0010913299|nr:HEPN domain-containing protein [Leptospira jelokensis]TGM07109.1 hypothetical protein EHQ79_00045 [Leptospira jelokensis]
MEARKDFSLALNEIKYFTKNAKKNEKDIWKYKLYNKSSLILLITKFEVYVENIIDEYMFICTKNTPSDKVPNPIKEYIEIDLLSGISKDILDKNKRKNCITNLFKVNNNNLIDLIDYEHKIKFNPGKHGEKELKRILSEIGLNLNEKRDIVSIYADYNSLNFLRNNIIHEDVSPNITHRDVIKFALSILKLANYIEEEISNSLTFA